MANQLGKNARLYIDDLDIYLRSFEMEQGIEARTADSGKFADDWESVEVIHGSGRLSVNAYMDNVYNQGDPPTTPQTANALDLAMWKILTGDSTPPVMKSNPAVITMVPFATPAIDDDGVIFSQGFGQFAIAPANNGLVALRAQLVNTGPINRGKILAIGTTSAITSGSPFVSTPVAQFVGDPPVNFLRASLHVFTFSLAAGTPTLTCTLESDPLVGFGGGGVTRLTFATFTTMTGEYKEQALNDTDEFYRVRITSDDAVNASTLGIIVVGHTS